ncbi:MAG: hypothetical protein IBJ03_00195 [Gemmatimonadaceae bacterium]|nr:hypothetical protein [Gemmatimonadaceae bacterium]
MHVHHRRARRVLGAVVLLAVGTAAGFAACAEIGTAPDQPAAIELDPFASPSIVVGDTLRNFDGVVTPMRAVVRNVAGDPIADAPVRYLYADFNRDSALKVDSATGVVVALKAISSEARLAARIGNSLQVLRALTVTVQPDTIEGAAPTSALNVRIPDTLSNRTGEFRVTLRNLQTTPRQTVNAWVVRYKLITPANPTNDTTAAAWLVDDNNRRTDVDTTDTGGTARRFVRVRGGQFPATLREDSVVVEVIAQYKGQAVRGGPLRLKAAVVDTTRR